MHNDKYTHVYIENTCAYIGLKKFLEEDKRALVRNLLETDKGALVW